MGKLVLVRHGESVWNEKGLWTGWTDVELDEKGKKQAHSAGEVIKDIQFNAAFTAPLKRTQHTLDEIKEVLTDKTFPNMIDRALLERNYGQLAGKNKWDVEKEYGEEQFMAWRRGWDDRPPGGESLHDVYERTIPYFENKILPRLIQGENILVVSSGNALRTIIKYLDHISDKDIENVEIKTGEVWEYEIDTHGEAVGKKILASNTDPGNQ